MRFKVADESMYPTLNSGDYLLVNKFARKFSAGDIVVFKHREKFLVKRIEKISGDEFFVVGDNDSASNDSRMFGMINKKAMIGKVFFHSKLKY